MSVLQKGASVQLYAVNILLRYSVVMLVSRGIYTSLVKTNIVHARTYSNLRRDVDSWHTLYKCETLKREQEENF